jgi:hypothetical protein
MVFRPEIDDFDVLHGLAIGSVVSRHPFAFYDP